MFEICTKHPPNIYFICTTGKILSQLAPSTPQIFILFAPPGKCLVNWCKWQTLPQYLAIQLVIINHKGIGNQFVMTYMTNQLVLTNNHVSYLTNQLGGKTHWGWMEFFQCVWIWVWWQRDKLVGIWIHKTIYEKLRWCKTCNCWNQNVTWRGALPKLSRHSFLFLPATQMPRRQCHYSVLLIGPAW